MSAILAWHFVGDRLRDGRPVPADGEKLVHAGRLALCSSGLHASELLIDALQYATGETICRVECDGEVLRGDDKLVCSERTILWRINGTALLRRFARQCALDVAHLWDMPTIVRDYLESGNEQLRTAARAAALASAAASAAALVRTTARTAAKDAATTAARARARIGACNEHNKLLTEMVEAAHAEGGK